MSSSINCDDLENSVRITPEELKIDRDSEYSVTIRNASNHIFQVKVECSARCIKVVPENFTSESKTSKIVVVKYDGLNEDDTAMIKLQFGLGGSTLLFENVPVRFMRSRVVGSSTSSSKTSTTSLSTPSATPSNFQTEHIVSCAQNAIHEAQVFCDTCKKDFCEDCFKLTHSFVSLSDHKKIPMAEKPIQLPKCPKCPHNFAEFLCKSPNCETERKLMCHTCRVGVHRDHPFEILIDILLENEKKAIALIPRMELKEAELQEKLVEVSGILESYDRSSEQHQSKSNEICEYIVEKKAVAMSRFEEFIDDEVGQMKKEIRELEEKLKKARQLKERANWIVRSKNELHLVDDIAENALELATGTIEESVHVNLGSLRLEWKNGVELSI